MSSNDRKRANSSSSSDVNQEPAKKKVKTQTQEDVASWETFLAQADMFESMTLYLGNPGLAALSNVNKQVNYLVDKLFSCQTRRSYRRKRTELAILRAKKMVEQACEETKQVYKQDWLRVKWTEEEEQVL